MESDIANRITKVVSRSGYIQFNEMVMDHYLVGETDSVYIMGVDYTQV